MVLFVPQTEEQRCRAGCISIEAAQRAIVTKAFLTGRKESVCVCTSGHGQAVLRSLAVVLACGLIAHKPGELACRLYRMPNQGKLEVSEDSRELSTSLTRYATACLLLYVCFCVLLVACLPATRKQLSVVVQHYVRCTYYTQHLATISVYVIVQGKKRRGGSISYVDLMCYVNKPGMCLGWPKGCTKV